VVKVAPLPFAAKCRAGLGSLLLLPLFMGCARETAFLQVRDGASVHVSVTAEPSQAGGERPATFGAGGAIRPWLSPQLGPPPAGQSILAPLDCPGTLAVDGTVAPSSTGLAVVDALERARSGKRKLLIACSYLGSAPPELFTTGRTVSPQVRVRHELSAEPDELVAWRRVPDRRFGASVAALVLGPILSVAGLLFAVVPERPGFHATAGLVTAAAGIGILGLGFYGYRTAPRWWAVPMAAGPGSAAVEIARP
jgi:hypothetical protein